MRDEDHRLLDLAVQAAHLGLQAKARDRVERAERLVHQQEWGVGCERARETDALPLAARELGGIALHVSGLEADELQELDATRPGLVLRPAEQPRDRGDVLADRHVREQADLLDHVADLAPQLDDGQIADAAAVDADLAGVERDQAVHHLQRRCLAAARRADENAERAGRDLQRQVVDRGRLAACVALGHVVERDLRSVHRLFLMPVKPMIPPAPTSAAVIHIAIR